MVTPEIEQLRALIDCAPTPLAYLQGEERRLGLANAAFCTAIGLNKTSLGRPLGEVWPEAAALPEGEEQAVRLAGKGWRVNLRRAPGGWVLALMEPPSAGENDFSYLVDASPAMLWTTDVDSRCTYLSKQWYAFTGRTPEQDLGFGWLENIHPEDLPETERVYANAVRDRGPIHLDYRLRRADGIYRWCIDVGFPRFDGQGAFAGYIGTVTDVHERLSLERQLQQTQDRFERSAAATDLGVWYCDLPFDELIWNKEVKRHFHMDPDRRVTIEDFYEHLHEDDRETTRRAIEHAIATHTPYDIIYRTIDPGDASRLKYVRAIGWTDYDRLMRPTRFDGITLDVTKEVQQRADLETAKEQAETANQTKSAFLANMSHEIRTPLGAILGFSELLRDATSQEERTEFARVISRNGKALTRLIDDILDLSKVEAGRLQLELLEIDLPRFLDDVLALFAEVARDKGLTLRCEIAEEVPRLLKSDPARIRQILVNLIGNAIKFTARGEVVVSAHGAYEETLELRVRDTGIGMNEAQMQSLFQPFVQADSSTTRQFGGTGLGLALSRKLAEALGGTVKLLACKKGEGCTFGAFVKITPLAQLAQSAVPAPTPVAPPRVVRVLLVDDSEDNQFLVKQVLRRQGFAVETAANGVEAVTLATTREYDIVLMDMQMPVLDGYGATEQLRARGYRRPIVALTAHAMAEERARTSAAGCDEHLTKPLDFKTLLGTIERLTSGPMAGLS